MDGGLGDAIVLGQSRDVPMGGIGWPTLQCPIEHLGNTLVIMGGVGGQGDACHEVLPCHGQGSDGTMGLMPNPLTMAKWHSSSAQARTICPHCTMPCGRGQDQQVVFLFPPRVRLISRRGQWRPGGWQSGRRGRNGGSGLQWAASHSVGNRASRFCDACDPASCGHGLAACGSDSDGTECKA